MSTEAPIVITVTRAFYDESSTRKGFYNIGVNIYYDNALPNYYEVANYFANTLTKSIDEASPAYIWLFAKLPSVMTILWPRESLITPES